MRFSEVAARLTGFSTPVFGVSFKPATSDVAVARGLIAFLEDRRVLYEPTEAEIRRFCIESVIQIRDHLTGALVAGGMSEDLTDHVRGMRASGRAFLSTVVAGDAESREFWLPDRRGRSGLDDWRLNQALGELRATVGIHIGQLAVKYGVDLEDGLASILPAAVE